MKSEMYLSPFAKVPFDRTVKHIAISSVHWWWLRAHMTWYRHSIPSSTCHFMNASDVSRLYPKATRAHAR